MVQTSGLRGATYETLKRRFWPGLPRFVLFAALAGCCAIVFYGRVYVTFDRVRITVVATEHSSSGGSVVVPLPDLSRLDASPIAIILNLHNKDRTTQRIMVSAGNSVLGRIDLRPEETLRADLSVQTGLKSGDRLTLMGYGDGWSLQQLEVGNAHGFSHGLFSLVIVPQSVDRYDSVSPFSALLLFAVLLGLSCTLFRFEDRTAGRAIEAILTAVVLILFFIVLILPMVSQFKVLLSVSAICVCVAVLYLPVSIPLARHAGHALWRMYPAALRFWARVRIRTLYGAVVVLFLISVGGFYSSETGFTYFIDFGDRWAARALPDVQAVPHYIREGSPGYDGQFYAQLAVDPLVQDPKIGLALDTFSYRAPRILFAWTAFLMGLGQPSLILHAYSIQNILCWLVLAWLLTRWVPPINLKNFVLWFGCLFGQGLMMSVRFSLLAGPSLLLLAAAIVAIERGRPWVATAVFGLSGLGRETNLLCGVCVLGRTLNPSRLVDVIVPVVRILLLGTPLALWVAYLHYSDHGAMFSAGPGNLATPFSAYLNKWGATLSELREIGWGDSYARFSLLTLVSLTTQALFLVWQRDWAAPWWRVGIMYAFLMVFLGPAVWAGYPGAVGRVLLPMTVAFYLQLSHTRGFWPLAVLGNLTVLQGLESIRVPWLWSVL